MTQLFLNTVQAVWDNERLEPKDILTLSEKNKKQAAEVISRNMVDPLSGYYLIPSAFKNRSGERMKESGQWYTQYLLGLHREKGGRFLSILIELGTKKLWSHKTRDLAKKVTDELLADYPAYCSIERANTTASKIHVHALVLLPNTIILPEKIKSYKVKVLELGTKPEYRHLSTRENVTEFLGYIMKGPDARIENKGSSNFKEMLLEWYLSSAANNGYLGKRVEGSERVRLSWTYQIPPATKIRQDYEMKTRFDRERFDRDNALGKIGEAVITSYLAQSGCLTFNLDNVMKGPFQRCDIVAVNAKGEKVTIEAKYDRAKTNRVALPIWDSSKKETGKRLPNWEHSCNSGIYTSEADVFANVSPHTGKIYFAYRESVLGYLDSNPSVLKVKCNLGKTEQTGIALIPRNYWKHLGWIRDYGPMPEVAQEADNYLAEFLDGTNNLSYCPIVNAQAQSFAGMLSQRY